MSSVAELILRALLDLEGDVDEGSLYVRVHRAAKATSDYRARIARLAPWSPWAQAFSDVLDGLGAAGLVEVRDALGRRRRDEDPEASRVRITDRGRSMVADPGTLARVARLLGFLDSDVLTGPAEKADSGLGLAAALTILGAVAMALWWLSL